jgi:hypothetical protein
MAVRNQKSMSFSTETKPPRRTTVDHVSDRYARATYGNLPRGDLNHRDIVDQLLLRPSREKTSSASASASGRLRLLDAGGGGHPGR